MAETKVISIEEIRAKAQGVVIQIPDWIPGQTISVRVKAIDMTPHIMQIDRLPNQLKTAAMEVFNGSKTPSKKSVEKAAEKLDMNSVDGMLPIIEGVAKESLVEPTYDEIQAIYPMTIVQKMEIFKFSMGGLDKLDSFR